jgi:hypothetical protein
VDILDQDLLEFHPKYQLKKGIEASMIEAKKEIVTQLSNITADTAVEPKRVEDIVKKAVRFWLECGTHWARLCLLMADPSFDTSRRKSSTGEKTRKLIINPTVKRVGNSIGSDFEKEDIVEGCNGKFTTMKM